MEMPMSQKRRFSAIFATVKKIYEIFTFIRLTPFRLDEIDLNKKHVVIFCRGTRTFIRTTLEEIIFDYNLILNLPSSQACILGYYYGKLQNEHKIKKTKPLFRRDEAGFLLHFTKGRFKIISLDRDSMLTYVDIKSKKTHVELPFVIAQQESIISQFDPSQACYIGVLAGIYANKQNLKPTDPQPRKVELTLVK